MNIRTKIEDMLRKNKEREEIEEKIRELEKEHEFGRISGEKYQEVSKKYEEELRKHMRSNLLPPKLTRSSPSITILTALVLTLE